MPVNPEALPFATDNSPAKDPGALRLTSPNKRKLQGEEDSPSSEQKRLKAISGQDGTVRYTTDDAAAEEAAEPMAVDARVDSKAKVRCVVCSTATGLQLLVCSNRAHTVSASYLLALSVYFPAVHGCHEGMLGYAGW
jgi:hypothetical protein